MKTINFGTNYAVKNSSEKVYPDHTEIFTEYENGTTCLAKVFKEGYSTTTYNTDLDLTGNLLTIAKDNNKNIIKAGTIIKVDKNGVSFITDSI